MEKTFSFAFPKKRIDPNNDLYFLVGEMQVEAVARLFKDGTLRTVDINTLTWRNENVTTFVLNCYPDDWEAIRKAAENHYPVTHVARKESSDHCANG